MALRPGAPTQAPQKYRWDKALLNVRSIPLCSKGHAVFPGCIRNGTVVQHNLILEPTPHCDSRKQLSIKEVSGVNREIVQ